MAKLMPCMGCQRHIRASDERCPFCGDEVVTVSTPGVPMKRLGRAALFAFGTTVLATGCGDSHDADAGPGGDTDAGPGGDFDAGPGGGVDAGPGGDFDAGPPPDDDAGFDAGNVAPPYGIPPDDDAGPERDGGPSVALYGGAPEP